MPQRGYVDIWLAHGDEHLAVELKYKTRALRAHVNGEEFDLLNQSAQDIGRYDTVKDIQRLEQIVASSPHSAGFVLLLTNDSSYWSNSRHTDSVDAAFRLHEGRLVTGELSWGAAASAGTRKGREAALLLSGSYPLNWKDYGQVSAAPYSRFRYVLVNVARRSRRSTSSKAEAGFLSLTDPSAEPHRWQSPSHDPVRAFLRSAQHRFIGDRPYVPPPTSAGVGFGSSCSDPD